VPAHGILASGLRAVGLVAFGRGLLPRTPRKHGHSLAVQSHVQDTHCWASLRALAKGERRASGWLPGPRGAEAGNRSGHILLTILAVACSVRVLVHEDRCPVVK
jgi:hypothetical protein